MAQHFKELEEYVESLPIEIRPVARYKFRYEKTRRLTTIFPDFCDHVLKHYPNHTYIFIDRDARPLYNTMEIFKKQKQLGIENRIITLTRDMLPVEICAITDKLSFISQDASLTFGEIEKQISEFVKQNKQYETDLHRYLSQEFDNLENMLFIDIGYWGRCTSYLMNYFDDSDYMLVRGPRSSKCFNSDDFGGESVNGLENQIKHGFEIKGLVEQDGMIIIRTEPEHYYKNHNLHIVDYMAIEANAYDHLSLLTDEKEFEIKKEYSKHIKEFPKPRPVDPLIDAGLGLC